MDAKELEKYVLSKAKQYLLESEYRKTGSNIQHIKVMYDKSGNIVRADIAYLPNVVNKKEEQQEIIPVPIGDEGNALVDKYRPYFGKQVNESKEKKQKNIAGPNQIKLLAEEMKKINKKIDFRNPLINPGGEDILKNIIEKEEKTDEKTLVQESTKNRWKQLLDYNIPTDDRR